MTVPRSNIPETSPGVFEAAEDLGPYESEIPMTIVTESQARKNLHALILKTAESHEPVFIKGNRRSSVLISADDWRALQETLALLSNSKVTDSIKRGLKTPLSKCRAEVGW